MYVPDEGVLGNPGLFGFIGGALKSVGQALGISDVKVSIPSPQISVTPTAQATQQAIQGYVEKVPSWVLPAAIGVGALLLLKGGRR